MLRRITKPALLLVPMVALGGLLSACGPSPSADLTVYSGQHPQLTAKLVAAFERKTGLKVVVRQSTEGVLPTQMATEGANSPADVVITENASPMNAMAERGLLAALPASTLESFKGPEPIPARWTPGTYISPTVGPGGRWVAVSQRVNVLVYNAKSVKPGVVPQHLADLAAPSMAGKLGLAPAEPDFTPVVSALIVKEGTKAATSWLEGAKSNAGPRTYVDNEELIRRIGLGQVAVATMDQYYWYRYRHTGGSKDVVMAPFAPGDVGNLVGVSPIGIARHAPHAAAARRFVDFVTSPAGQRVVASSGSYEYPARPNSPTPPGLPPISSFGVSSVSPAQLGSGAAALALMTKVQLL